MSDQLSLSWSGMNAFMSCPRKYQLGYIEGLVRPDSGHSLTPVTGSHVHAGWEAALRSRFEHPQAALGSLVRDALFGIRNYRIENLDASRQIYSYEENKFVPDEAYFSMMDRAFDDAREIIEYQVPRFDWERYQPVSLEDLFGDRAAEILEHSTSLHRVDQPLVEWAFALPARFEDGSTATVNGVIDAVVFDRQQVEYIMIDWKTRRSMPDPVLVALDGQLQLYGAVINAFAGESLIRRGVMYQIAMSVPKQAKTTQKNVPSMAIPGSTWEVWSNSVKMLGFDPEDYREDMLPKMQPPEHYTNPVEIALNLDVDRRTFENLAEAVSLITSATEAETFPGILSSTGCQFCPFKKICHAYQGGGDADTIIQKEFIVKSKILRQEEIDEA